MVTFRVNQQASPLSETLGILGGLVQGFEGIRQRREAQQLQALSLLARQPGYEVSPLAAAEAPLASFGDRLLSGTRYQPTEEGTPVLNVGGSPVTVRRRPLVDFGPLLDTVSAVPVSGDMPLVETVTRSPGPGVSATTRAGTAVPVLPQLPSQVVPLAEAAQQDSVRLARARYQAQPTPENEQAVLTALAQAKQELRAQRNMAYQREVEQYKLAREDRKLANEERKLGAKVEYGFGNDVDAEIYSTIGDRLRQENRPPTQVEVATATQRVRERQLDERIRVAQHTQEIGLGNVADKTTTAAQATPLQGEARVRVGALMQAEDVAKALATEFTPEERAKFVGLGGLRYTGQQLQQLLADAKSGRADPRFARFAALVSLQGAEAFATAGKALTDAEKGVVFGYIPTGKEYSAQEFEEKLTLAQERIPAYIDSEIKLAATPVKDLLRERQRRPLGPAGRRMTQADIDTTVASSGRTRDEVLAAARAKGFTVEE